MDLIAICFHRRWIGLLGALPLLGCTNLSSPAPLPIYRHDQITLARDEGILVVDVASEVAISRLFIGSRPVLVRPEQLLLVVMEAGVYSFEKAQSGVSSIGHSWTYPFDWLERNEFEVEAGRVNYPGKLIIQQVGRKRFTARVVNRSATVLETLTRRFPAVLEAYPLRYAGFMRDDFYAEYLGAQKQRRASAGEGL